jgi:hypothetical protein
MLVSTCRVSTGIFAATLGTILERSLRRQETLSRGSWGRRMDERESYGTCHPSAGKRVRFGREQDSNIDNLLNVTKQT